MFSVSSSCTKIGDCYTTSKVANNVYDFLNTKCCGFKCRTFMLNGRHVSVMTFKVRQPTRALQTPRHQ